MAKRKYTDPVPPGTKVWRFFRSPSTPGEFVLTSGTYAGREGARYSVDADGHAVRDRLWHWSESARGAAAEVMWTIRGLQDRERYADIMLGVFDALAETEIYPLLPKKLDKIIEAIQVRAEELSGLSTVLRGYAIRTGALVGDEQSRSAADTLPE